MRYLPIIALALLCAAPAVVQAQDHAWINVDVGWFKSGQDAQTVKQSRTLSSEIASAAAAYPALPGMGGFALSGGVGITKGIGFGARFYEADYDSIVGLTVNIPRSYFFSTPATDSQLTTSPLRRKERGFDISAVYTVPSPNSLRVRIFSGPTFFHATNNMIGAIVYNQGASPLVGVNSVTITSHTDKEASGSGVGFHVGGDIAWFFSRNVGVGGMVRFNRGTIAIAEPLSGQNADLKVGHTGVGGGLRLRF